MATIFICDRCKRELKERKALYQVEIQSNSEDDDNLYDLCENCIVAIKTWITGVPGKVKPY